VLFFQMCCQAFFSQVQFCSDEWISGEASWLRPHLSSIQKPYGNIDSVPAPVNMCFILDIKFSMLQACPHMIDGTGCGYICLQVNSIYIKILWMSTLLIFMDVFFSINLHLHIFLNVLSFLIVPSSSNFQFCLLVHKFVSNI
jgi:hypothetical protein